MRKKIIFATIIIILLAALVAAFFKLQATLNRSLERVMREEVEPSLRSSLHAEADIEKASISILRGSVLLQGIRIGNPQGFSGPDCLRVKKCEIKIGLLPIMKGRMDEISAIIVQDAELNLQRNAEGGINAIHLLAGRGRPKKAPLPKNLDTAPYPEFSLPRIAIHSADISGRLRLHDESVTNAVTIELDFQTRARNISTFGETTNMPCRITVDAWQSGIRDSCNVLVHIKAAPIQNPLQPDFVLTADMQAFPIPVVAPYFSRLGVLDGALSGALRMNCSGGILEPKGSSLELTFGNPQLSELAVRRLGSFSVPSTFRMTIPLAGLFLAPETDVNKAWEQALRSAQNIGAIIDATDKDSLKPDVIKSLFERGNKQGKTQ